MPQKDILSRKDIDLILNLRWEGISERNISDLFGIDRTTVRYYCKKHGIVAYRSLNLSTPHGRPSLHSLISEMLKKERKWVIIDGEKINRGKSYKEYLAEGR